MATNFTHSFLDIQGNTHNVTFSDPLADPVLLYDIKYSAETPVSIQHQGVSKDEWDSAVIIGQELIFRFYVPRADVSELDGVFESDHHQYILEYYDSNNLKFIGYINPENMVKRYERNPPYVEIEISASDALYELKDIDFVTYTEDGVIRLIQGPYTLLELLKMALGTLGTGITSNFIVQLNTYEKLLMTASECTLSKLTLYGERFVYFENANDVEATYMSCWDVVTEILKPFGCKLLRVNGVYTIINFSEISSYEYYILWSDLSLVSRTAVNRILDISTYKFIPNIQQSKVRPIKELTTTLSNRERNGYVTTFDVNDWVTNWDIYFDSYEVGENGEFLGTFVNVEDPIYNKRSIELKVGIPVDSILEQDWLEIEFNYEILSGANGNNFRVLLQIIHPNGTLGDPVFLPLNTFYKYSGKQYPQLRIFVAGNYKIRISVEAITVPSVYEWTAIVVSISGIYVTKRTTKVADEYQLEKETFDRKFIQKNTKGFAKREETVLLGDCSQLTEVAALMKQNTYPTPWQLTSQWCDYGSVLGDGVALVDLFARTILQNNSRFKNYLRGGVIDRNHTIGFQNILKIEGKLYNIINYEKNVRTGELSFELVEMVTTRTY